MRLHFLWVSPSVNQFVSLIQSGKYFFIFWAIGYCSTLKINAQCPITVDAGPDQYVCNPPAAVTLDGNISGNYLGFVWTPTTGMTGANTLTPTVNVNQTLNYVLSANAVDPGLNVVENGDFEQGNSGFSTDYIYNPGFTMFPFGSYEVASVPAAFPACPDHTSGSGNYMVVDGAQTPNLFLWCQTVTVTPNTQYELSAWALSFVTNAPFALLRFTINGVQIGGPLSVPPPQCFWHPFSAIWNSGANTSATICIENLTVTGSNNDFGLDDIALSPVCTQTDTVKVQIVNISAVANPSFVNLPCAGATLTLNGTGSSTGADISYLWETSDGNIVSGGTTLTPVIDQPGTYTLTVSYDYGTGQCTKSTNVTVILNPNALSASIFTPQPLGCGGTTVNITGQSNQGAVSYAWSTTDGNIVAGANTVTAQVDQPGTYTLTVTNIFNGCTATAQTTVIVANNPPIAIANASGPINCQALQSNLSGSGSSTGGTIQYSWSSPNGIIVSGQNSINAVAGSGGLFILRVLNTSNTCFTLDSVLVVADTMRPTISLVPPGVLNCLVDTLPIIVTITPNDAVLLWTAGPGGSIAGSNDSTQLLVLTPAVYQLLVTDTSNFCTQTLSVTVNIDVQTPVAVVGPANNLTCQQTSVVLNGAGSSTGPNITYQWSSNNGGNVVSDGQTLNPVVNAPGLYQLLVTNTINGCTDTATVQVTADANVIVAVANALDTLDCQTFTVGLNSTGSTNVPGLLYAWSIAAGSTGNFTSAVDGPTAQVDAPGTYQLLITNPASGCTAVDFAIVAIDTLKPDVQIALPDTITCVQPNLTLVASNTDSIGVYTYTWTTIGGNIVSGNNTLMPLVNAAGQYILLSAQTNNGCSATDTVTVVIATGAPTAVIAQPDTLDCAKLSFQLSSTGSSVGPEFEYAWSATNGGLLLSPADQPNPDIGTAGDYKLIITNVLNGCTALDSVTVLRDTLAPPALAGADTVLLTCLQTTAQLLVNQGLMVNVQYAWSTIGGNIAGNPNLDQITVNQPGAYIVLVTNPENACTASDTLLVNADQVAPDLQVLPTGAITCKTPTAALQASSSITNLTYLWQTGNGTLVAGQTTALATASTPGSYEVTGTNPANGCNTVDTIIVSIDTIPPVAATADTVSLTCFDPQLQLVGFTNNAQPLYSWTSAQGTVLSGATTNVALVNQPGTYLFTVQDSLSGCSASDSIIVLQQSTPPTVNAGFDRVINCNVQIVDLQGMAGVYGVPSYQWIDLLNQGNIIGDPKNLAIQVDGPGIFVLTVRDTITGCEAFDTVRVFIDTLQPVAKIGNPQVLTCALKQFNLLSIGTNPPGVNFAWTALNGGNIVAAGNTSSPLIDSAGTYNLLVTNPVNGCTAVASVVVTQNISPPPISVNTAAPMNCTDTTRTLQGNPASGNYQYSWSTINGNIVSGAQQSNPTVNQAGDYQLVLTDNQTGCQDSTVLTLTIDTIAPQLNIQIPDTLDCSLKTIPLQGIPLPAFGNTALWSTSNGQIVGANNNLNAVAGQAGTYILTITSLQNGCKASAMTTVLQNITPPVAQAVTGFKLTCTAPSGDVNGSASSGIGSLSYQWSTLNGSILSNGNSAVALVGASGTYVLQVQDNANGCTDTAQVVVLADTSAPKVQILPALPFTCLRDSALLNANGSSVGANFTENWTDINGLNLNQQQGLNATVLDTGMYILTIENQQNGCATSDTVLVEMDRLPPNADAGPPLILFCTQPKVALLGNSSTGPGMQFSWSTTNGVIDAGAQTQSPIASAPGNYVLTVTNPNNGCTAVSNTNVSEVDLPAFELNVIQPSCIDPSTLISIEDVKGGVGPYTYAIDGGVIFQTQSIFTDLAPATYYPVVRDQFGCTSFQTVKIEAPKIPKVKLSEFTLIELGTGYTMLPITTPGPDSIALWAWSPADHLSCTDCPNPIASPLETTEYTLTVTDIFGCTALDRIQVRVNPSRYVYFPNIISPNGDGENERFTLFGRNVAEIELLQIFNRWGALVYEKNGLLFNDELDGWDGRVKGEPPLPGVYVWQARIRYSDGVVDWFKGDVTVIR